MNISNEFPSHLPILGGGLQNKGGCSEKSLSDLESRYLNRWRREYTKNPAFEDFGS